MFNIPLRNIAAVLVRLFTILIVIYSIRNISAAFSYSSLIDNSDSYMLGITISIHVIIILFAVYLWKFPFSVANKILPKEAAATKEQLYSAEQLEVVGFSIVGLFYLFNSITNLFYWGLLVWFKSRAPEYFEPDELNEKIQLVTSVFETVLAALIILKARGLAGLLRKIRHAGS